MAHDVKTMAHKVHRHLLLALPAVLAVVLSLGTSEMAWAQKGGKPPKSTSCTAFQDNFDGNKVDGTRWVVANGSAPGRIVGSHIGYYQPDRVSVSGGYLHIRLTQEGGIVDGVSGVISRGGLVYTKQTCGYGTYIWNVRMSSTQANPTDYSGFPVPGSVSAGFNYVNNSQTEIDYEFSAKDPDTLWMVTWLNTNPQRDPTSQDETYFGLQPFDSTSGFHEYKYVWVPGKITYYIDGEPQAEHTTDVPSAPAYFMINHWGTNGPGWGGYATIGVTRYYHIDSVSYSPLQ